MHSTSGRTTNKVAEAVVSCLGLLGDMRCVYVYRSMTHDSYFVFACREMIHRLGVCVRVLGDVSQLPESLQHAIGKAVHVSQGNTR